MNPGTARRRVGVLGGAFNPPHEGHLRLAHLAVSHLGLDEVRFIPSAVSPHKAEAAVPGPIRMAMLEAALQEAGGPFVADDLELTRGGVSWTVDTLEALHEREPGHAWIWLIGSDLLPGLPGWRNLPRILELASVAVSLRPGHALDLPGALALRWSETWSGEPGQLVPLPGTELDLASSAIRESCRNGGAPEGTGAQVRGLITREHLYSRRNEESE